MSLRFVSATAAAAACFVALASTTAHAELSLPPQLSPGVPALITDPTPTGIESEPGPREPVPPAKKAPAVKAKKPKKSAVPKRVSLDLARRGLKPSVGLSYRVFEHLDLGYSGLIVGRSTGSEFHGTLFTKLGALRPMIAAGVPIYNSKGTLYPGFRSIGTVEWRPTKVIGFFGNVTINRFPKELAKVEKSGVLPGAGILLYL